MAHPGPSAPVDADAVSFRQPLSHRVGIPLMSAILGISGTLMQLRNGLPPWQLLFVVAAVGLAWLMNRTDVVSDRHGVYLRRGRLTPWCDVAELVRPPDNGWKHQTATLVLNDGSRRPLRPDLTPDHLDRMDRWLQASRATEPPTDD